MGAVVYPTIIQDLATGKLIKLDGEAAYEHAMKKGEYIKFDSGEQANWFATHYKLGFGK